MNHFEIEVLLTLALGTGVFFLISFLENLFRPRLSPTLRKFLWLFFILKMAVPLGIVSPLVFSLPSPEISISVKIQPSLVDTPTVPMPLITQAPLLAHTTEPPLDTRSVLFTVYLLGLGLFFGLSLFNRFKMARYLKKSHSPSKEVLELLHEAKMRNGVNRLVKMREVPGLNSPTLLGLFHPQILMPLGVTKLYTPQEISLMLDHELSHLKAQDHWLWGLVNLVQMILWFHPGVWLGRNRFLLALEEACDQRVLGNGQENSRQFYGLTLLKVLSQGQGKLRMIPSMASPKRMVKDRLVLLTRKIRVSPLAVGLLSAIFLGACAVGIPLVKPEEKKVPELTVKIPSQSVQQTKTPPTTTKPEQVIVKGIPKMLWPVSKPGKVTMSFGPSIHQFTGQGFFHNGIDIAEAIGTPIFAAHEGIVVAVDYQPLGYGNYLEIENTSGYSTRYGHLARFAPLTLGQKVSRGDVIGEVGVTGMATGPHLHFEVHQGTQILDPTPNLEIPTGVTFLKPEGVTPTDLTGPNTTEAVPQTHLPLMTWPISGQAPVELQPDREGWSKIAIGKGQSIQGVVNLQGYAGAWLDLKSNAITLTYHYGEYTIEYRGLKRDSTTEYPYKVNSGEVIFENAGEDFIEGTVWFRVRDQKEKVLDLKGAFESL